MSYIFGKLLALALALNASAVNFSYQETILVHPTRLQIFYGKSDSSFYNIWDLLI